MMILTGPHDTAEYAAAIALQQRITAAWPDLATHSDQHLALIVAAKCYGEPVCDLDLVLLLDLTRAPRPLPIQGAGPTVLLASACVIIEVKHHARDNVRFLGNQVEVRYRDRWHNVSEQSFKQRFALKDYLAARQIAPPFIVNLIWLRTIPQRDLPAGPHDIIGSDATWETVLARLRDLYTPYPMASGARRIHAGGAMSEVIQYFTTVQAPQPTLLEQQKMTGVIRATRTITAAATVPAYVAKLGQQLLIFQGRGGTGKTASLLKLATALYEHQQARILILTYNRALVADIKRLLTLLGIHDGTARQSISVQTAHAFFHQLLYGLGVIPPQCPDFLEHYDAYKAEALDRLRALPPGSTSHLESLIQVRTEAFSWDYLFIDEAQDWPADERDLLFAVDDYRRFVLDDGLDQLIRGQSIDWRAHIDKQQSQVVTLRKSLRLKAGVCAFVNAFATHVGLTDWLVEPFGTEAGRVIIVEGYYAQSQALHRDLLQQHVAQQRAPIDMLFCVPPRLVRKAAQGESGSVITEVLERWGHRCWDATHAQTSRRYPTDPEQVRIVPYDSCRGLEAWTVVHLGFDELYTYKVNTFVPPDAAREDRFFDRDAAARASALRWLMIPLTRAVHTLVLQIKTVDHPVGRILAAIAAQHPELVEWRHIPWQQQQR